MHIPTFIDQKFRWLAVPGLILAIAFLQAIMFVVLLLKPEAYEVIRPDLALLMEGQIWRFFSFILIPAYQGTLGQSILFPALFTLIMVKLFTIFEETLERAWGTTRTSLYVFALIICQGIVVNIFPGLLESRMYYLAIFFAFATLMPDYTLMLFFIFPVKVWILAALAGIGIILMSLGSPFIIPILIFAYLPYLAWAIPHLWKCYKTKKHILKRRSTFDAAKMPQQDSLHLCTTCGKTEVTDSVAEFRVAADGEEYCLDHLP